MLLKHYFKISSIEYRKTELCCISIPFLLVLIQLLYGIHLIYSLSLLDTTPGLTIKVIGNQ